MSNNSTQNHDTTSITIKEGQSSTEIPTNSHNLILRLSALSFFTGLTGSALYARRKASKYLKETTTLSSHQLNSSVQFRQAFIFSLQAFAVGSIVCVSASGLIALGVGAILGVRNLYEFHEKMKEIIPIYTPGLRKAVRNSHADQQEWKIFEEEWAKFEEKNKYAKREEE